MKPASDPKGDYSKSEVVVHFSLNFRHLCIVTALIPFCTLVICFITAIIYQNEEVHETHCQVYNIIPSISAITGVSPQRYLWRLSVAIHIGPRYIIAATHRSYLRSFIGKDADLDVQRAICRWLEVAFWCNVLEVSALAGVTYISNMENYFLHEKLFMFFMFCSLWHMLASLKALQNIAISKKNSKMFGQEIFYKKILLIISIISTVFMAAFFAEHRLLCRELAFSRFAFCEYIIATANIMYHCTLISHFPSEHLVIARGLHKTKHENAWKLY
ncbi:hypothetical protein Trydic_g6240 [Trypoxylus dichotomus]